jgi:hypothetical protein
LIKDINNNEKKTKQEGDFLGEGVENCTPKNV